MLAVHPEVLHKAIHLNTLQNWRCTVLMPIHRHPKCPMVLTYLLPSACLPSTTKRAALPWAILVTRIQGISNQCLRSFMLLHTGSLGSQIPELQQRMQLVLIGTWGYSTDLLTQHLLSIVLLASDCAPLSLVRFACETRMQFALPPCPATYAANKFVLMLLSSHLHH